MTPLTHSPIVNYVATTQKERLIRNSKDFVSREFLLAENAKAFFQADMEGKPIIGSYKCGVANRQSGSSSNNALDWQVDYR